MNTQSVAPQPLETTKASPKPLSAVVLVRFLAATAAFAGLLFLTAGTIAWTAAWIYLGIITAVMVAYASIVARLHPDLAQERHRPPADAKQWDKPFVAVIAGVGPLALLLVSGLDHRFHWTAPLPVGVIATGLLLVAAGGSLANYAVAVNRFFSALVRIQRDRGHAVVDRGPYRVVRHPGYAGSILHMFGTGLALGSLRAVGVAALVTLVVAVRTEREDRTLRAELSGYREYAARVRYRLIPGIW